MKAPYVGAAEGPGPKFPKKFDRPLGNVLLAYDRGRVLKRHISGVRAGGLVLRQAQKSSRYARDTFSKLAYDRASRCVVWCTTGGGCLDKPGPWTGVVIPPRISH